MDTRGSEYVVWCLRVSLTLMVLALISLLGAQRAEAVPVPSGYVTTTAGYNFRIINIEAWLGDDPDAEIVLDGFQRAVDSWNDRLRVASIRIEFRRAPTDESTPNRLLLGPTNQYVPRLIANVFPTHRTQQFDLFLDRALIARAREAGVPAIHYIQRAAAPELGRAFGLDYFFDDTPGAVPAVMNRAQNQYLPQDADVAGALLGRDYVEHPDWTDRDETETGTIRVNNQWITPTRDYYRAYLWALSHWD